MKLLRGLAQASAVLGGGLLTAITWMTCASLIGRNTTGWTLVGDFELSGAAAGAAIALFMPWCQVQRGHIIVDFFTARATARTRDGLDRLGAGALAAVMALLTWRTALGGLSAWETQAGSMMLGLPEWLVYSAMVPALALSSLVAAVQALFGFEVLRGAATAEAA